MHAKPTAKSNKNLFISIKLKEKIITNAKTITKSFLSKFFMGFSTFSNDYLIRCEII